MGRAIVIGAGLAGVAVASALARRHWQVTILESGPSIAPGASGNAAGIILPHIAIEANPTTRFSQLCRAFLIQRLSECRRAGLDVRFHLCGVLSLARDEKELRRMERALSSAANGSVEDALLVSAFDASQKAGIELRKGGVFFPDSGWVDPGSLCRALLEQSQNEVQVFIRQRVESVERQHLNGPRGLWLAKDSSGQTLAEGDIVVVANAFDCRYLVQTSWIPLFRVRGQVQIVEPSVETQALKTVLSFGGYVTPAVSAGSEAGGLIHAAGATFDWKDMNPLPRPADANQILGDLEAVAPCFGAAVARTAARNEPGRSRVSFRATSPDTLPMVGMVPDPQSPRHHVRRREGLYVSVGHGSRGLLYTQLSGELLAAQICGESLPVPEELVASVDPARFLIRAWRRPQALS